MNPTISFGYSGQIKSAHMGELQVPFREAPWSGPSFRIVFGGQLHTDSLAEVGEDGWVTLNFWGVQLRRRTVMESEGLVFYAQMENRSSQTFRPESVGLLLGVDTYMVRYPDWDQQFFPTLLRCEATHFYGYFSTPAGSVMGIACAEPIASWTMHYNQHFCDCGHRVEGVTLELLSSSPLPLHHPENHTLISGECREWRIVLYPSTSIEDALATAARLTEAPVFVGQRLIFEPGECVELPFCAPARFTAMCEGVSLSVEQRGAQWRVHLAPDRVHTLRSLVLKYQDKVTEVTAYWRKPWSWYMTQAAQAALAHPQKASSHAETWYGLFSGFIAMGYLPDTARDTAILQAFHALAPLIFDLNQGVPLLIPGRIQNISTLVSLCVACWKAKGDDEWLDIGARFADYLIHHCQDTEGAFRNGEGVHYTCVAYLAKSILELWLVEKHIPKRAKQATLHFDAAQRAVDDLVVHLDDIGTEGEHTFEDGMISCAVAQIALFALLIPPDLRQRYIAAAETLQAKHRCLERMGAPDCRSRNTTIRFWEAQYDLLIPMNMITSPHGWSAWKIYGVWYLYLLTGNAAYLVDAMETLGCCAQLLDDTGTLRWGYVVDPQVRAGQWHPDSSAKGSGCFNPETFGECYLPMISGWYHAPENTPVFGYRGEYPGFSTDQGGCCDNDVHECFKAMGEMALCYAYWIETESTPIAYNLRTDTTIPLRLIPLDAAVQAVHVNLRNVQMVEICFGSSVVRSFLKCGWICRNGTCQEGLPGVSMPI